MTIKIWDRSAVDHTLESLVHDFSSRANAHKNDVAVHLTGPNTFTLSLNTGAL
ncbi:hypothetical protein [Arthrobacter globiformis]|nr:hypothetical protein [Arthrobacter globiformis]